MTYAEDAAAISAHLSGIRRELHRRPEVGLRLPRTQETVLRELDGLGLEVSTGTSSTSVTAVLRGRPTGHAVLLRGDMDALPLTEETGLDFASENAGTMHACGHDLHTTMLLGAAQLLSAHRDELDGDVVFMFQPGEEGWDGAGHMIAEGVLDAAGPRVGAAYGLHVMAAGVPHDVLVTRPGPMMAAADGLYVTVRGAGGHASAPHRAHDPITVAAALIGEIQTWITRNVDIFEPAVLTVGLFHAGTIRNIIPDEAHFEATVRTFSTATREVMAEGIVRLAEGFAAAHGLTADVRFDSEFVLTSNDVDETAFAAEVVHAALGDDHFELMAEPVAGSEDFAKVLDAVPGCYLFLGAGPVEGWQNAPYNHSPRAVFDEAVLPTGVTVHAELATRALTRLSAG